MHQGRVPVIGRETSKDTCFCLFYAASPDAVRAINTEGKFALDRITRAILLLPRPDPPNAPDRERTS